MRAKIEVGLISFNLSDLDDFCLSNDVLEALQ